MGEGLVIFSDHHHGMMEGPDLFTFIYSYIEPFTPKFIY